MTTSPPGTPADTLLAASEEELFDPTESSLPGRPLAFDRSEAQLEAAAAAGHAALRRELDAHHGAEVRRLKALWAERERERGAAAAARLSESAALLKQLESLLATRGREVFGLQRRQDGAQNASGAGCSPQMARAPAARPRRPASAAMARAGGRADILGRMPPTPPHRRRRTYPRPRDRRTASSSSAPPSSCGSEDACGGCAS